MLKRLLTKQDPSPAHEEELKIFQEEEMIDQTASELQEQILAQLETLTLDEFSNKMMRIIEKDSIVNAGSRTELYHFIYIFCKKTVTLESLEFFNIYFLAQGLPDNEFLAAFNTIKNDFVLSERLNISSNIKYRFNRSNDMTDQERKALLTDMFIEIRKMMHSDQMPTLRKKIKSAFREFSLEIKLEKSILENFKIKEEKYKEKIQKYIEKRKYKKAKQNIDALREALARFQEDLDSLNLDESLKQLFLENTLGKNPVQDLEEYLLANECHIKESFDKPRSGRYSTASDADTSASDLDNVSMVELPSGEYPAVRRRPLDNSMALEPENAEPFQSFALSRRHAVQPLIRKEDLDDLAILAETARRQSSLDAIINDGISDMDDDTGIDHDTYVAPQSRRGSDEFGSGARSSIIFGGPAGSQQALREADTRVFDRRMQPIQKTRVLSANGDKSSLFKSRP